MREGVIDWVEVERGEKGEVGVVVIWVGIMEWSNFGGVRL